MKIKNSVIIVTGASQGIGLAAAKLLAEKGAKVVLAARTAKDVEKIAKSLPDAIAVPTDMRKPADIENLIKKTAEKYGRIDILINNAGQGMSGPVEKIDIEAYKNIMELNVFGVLRAMQAAIPVMRKQGGGMIVNVSSRVSKNYFPSLAAYSSTKYALNSISLTARAELAPDNIIVSVMHPKMTDTNFFKNSTGRPSEAFSPASIQRRRAAAVAEMQVDTPEDVAKKIAELIESEEPEASM